MSIIGRKAKNLMSGCVYEIVGLVETGVVVTEDSGHITRMLWGDLVLLPQKKPDMPRPMAEGVGADPFEALAPDSGFSLAEFNQSTITGAR